MGHVNIQTPVAGAAHARNLTEQQKLRLQRAVRDFEAIVVGYMLKSSQESSRSGALLDEGFGGEMMGGMLDGELSRTMSASGQLGIAEMLYYRVTGERLSRPAPETGPTGTRTALPPAVRSAPSSTRAHQPEEKPQQKETTAPRPQGVGRQARPAPVHVKLGQTVAERVMTYTPHVREAAELTGVDESLLRAVMAAESGGNPRARSPKQAKGLMQLIDSTAREVGVRDSWNPRENILGGARYLAKLLGRFDGDLTRAVASYNAGPGAVAKHQGIPPFPETQTYVKRVLGYLDYFTAQSGEGDD